VAALACSNATRWRLRPGADSVEDMSDTYTAELIGPDGTETIELDFIEGLPQKSFVRAAPGEEDADPEEIVWELVPSTDESTFRYQSAGSPGADYS
jgi:hypothetical protein